MQQSVVAGEGAFHRFLLEMMDLGTDDSAVPREKHLTEACRLLGAEVLYTVTPAAAGWIKSGVGPQGPLGGHPLSHLSGIVRHVLSKRARFLEARLPARGNFNRHQDGWTGIEIASYIATPIHRRGSTRGVLVLLRGPARPPFDVADLSRADLLADALAIREVNEERIAELAKQARTDSLTAVANYRHLRESVGRELLRAGAADAPLALVLVAIDPLKQAAETFGPLAISESMRRLARVLERNVRGDDLVSHHAGGTFVILMPGTSREGARCAVERLRRAVAEETAGPIPRLPMGCRWGIACHPADGADWTALMTSAGRDLAGFPPARTLTSAGDGEAEEPRRAAA